MRRAYRRKSERWRPGRRLRSILATCLRYCGICLQRNISCHIINNNSVQKRIVVLVSMSSRDPATVYWWLQVSSFTQVIDLRQGRLNVDSPSTTNTRGIQLTCGSNYKRDKEHPDVSRTQVGVSYFGWLLRNWVGRVTRWVVVDELNFTLLFYLGFKSVPKFSQGRSSF